MSLDGEQQVLRESSQGAAVEDDLQDLAGPRGNNALRRAEGETAAKRGVGAGHTEGGLNQTSVGHQHLDNNSYSAIVIRKS